MAKLRLPGREALPGPKGSEMRAFATVVLASLLSTPAVTVAHARSCVGGPGRPCHVTWGSGRHRHLAGLRYRHVARSYHIPRFDQGEAEDFVHTVYPYRTGLYVPWPDAYGAPYPY